MGTVNSIAEIAASLAKQSASPGTVNFKVVA